jgi:hypothetical protein
MIRLATQPAACPSAGCRRQFCSFQNGRCFYFLILVILPIRISRYGHHGRTIARDLGHGKNF